MTADLPRIDISVVRPDYPTGGPYTGTVPPAPEQPWAGIHEPPPRPQPQPGPGDVAVLGTALGSYAVVRSLWPREPSISRRQYVLVPAAEAPELVARLGLTTAELYRDRDNGGDVPSLVLGLAVPRGGDADGQPCWGPDARGYPAARAAELTRAFSAPRREADAERMRKEAAEEARQESYRLEAERRRARRAEERAIEEAAKKKQLGPLYKLYEHLGKLVTEDDQAPTMP